MLKKDVYGLTNPQKNIWYLEKFYNNSSLNTICGTAFVNEVTDYERDILYPLATERKEIDLDDGVKVNYLKFGKALKDIGLKAKK